MPDTQSELLDEVKELRRVIHAGLVVIAAQITANRDNTKTEEQYISQAFVQVQHVLASLRQPD